MSLLNCRQLDNFVAPSSNGHCANEYYIDATTALDCDAHVEQRNDRTVCDGENRNISFNSHIFQNQIVSEKSRNNPNADISAVNDTFCFLPIDSLNSCASDACCSPSASINSADGDRQRSLADASQLFSQSKLNVRSEQPKPIINVEMKQKRKEYENIYQQQQKESKLGKQYSLTSKEPYVNVSCYSSETPAQTTNYNMYLKSSCGNQLLYDESGCLDVPNYSTNSKRVTNLDNTLNCQLRDAPSDGKMEDTHLQRHALCSVSSDPEVYTKSPSVHKLNNQIQKLRDDMVSVRD